MDIPTHFCIARDDRGGYTEPYERGGLIKSIRLEVPSEKRFPAKFGKRVKALGGRYDNCRGRYQYTRTVRFNWSWAAEKLLEDVLRFFESKGDEQAPIEVIFITDHGDFDTRTDRCDMTARDLVESVRERVHSNCSRDDRSEVHSTCEEAEEFIARMAREEKERERVWAEAATVEKELISAFDEAGFPTQYGSSVSFDVKTSKKLIEFLKEQ